MNSYKMSQHNWWVFKWRVAYNFITITDIDESLHEGAIVIFITITDLKKSKLMSYRGWWQKMALRLSIHGQVYIIIILYSWFLVGE